MKKLVPFNPNYSVTPDGKVFKGDRLLTTSTKGCVRVALSRKMWLVSEIVASTYLQKPKNASKVIYLDGNNQNVSVDNLMWVSDNYEEIDLKLVEFNGVVFRHITCLETKQYFISEEGFIFNFATHKIIKPVKDSIGYLRFTYYYRQMGILKKKTIAVHILVYLTYCGNYDNLLFEINHLDGNKLNNHVSNLEVISHQENVKHARRMGLQRRKYSDLTIKTIASMLLTKTSWLAIASTICELNPGMSKKTAYSLINIVANVEGCYQDLCEAVGFVKRSTTSRKA